MVAELTSSSSSTIHSRRRYRWLAIGAQIRKIHLLVVAGIWNTVPLLSDGQTSACCCWLLAKQPFS
jgi:hypothetical protein